jgi:hypothetical protein
MVGLAAHPVPPGPGLGAAPLKLTGRDFRRAALPDFGLTGDAVFYRRVQEEGEHCREWEKNADPDGSQFPRAKRHDDKVIAAIRLN